MPARTVFVTGASLLLAALLFGPPAEAQEDLGCTLTQGFWKTHPDAWPDELMLGGIVYASADLIELLATPPRGDATYILAKQLIAAKLNVMNGAESPAGLIVEADEWLYSVGGLGTWPTGDARVIGIGLASQLDDFNNGLSGVPHCEDGPVPSPTPEPTPEPPQD